MMLIHADFDYCRHFGDLHEPGSTGVLLLHIPNSGCTGYCLVNVCFANCIKQPQRKIPRPIYNQVLAVNICDGVTPVCIKERGIKTTIFFSV